MTKDNRPGMCCGSDTRGYVDNDGSKRKPWKGHIERHFACWTEIMASWRFRTSEEAEAWVKRNLDALDQWEERRMVKWVNP